MSVIDRDAGVQGLPCAGRNSHVDRNIAPFVGWARCAWNQTSRLMPIQMRTVTHHGSIATYLPRLPVRC